MRLEIVHTLLAATSIQRPFRLLFSRFYLYMFVLLTALLLAPSNTNGQQSSGPVIAHWIVPMPYASGEEASQRAQNDIRAAMEEGLDGFAFNVFNEDQAKRTFDLYLSAADKLGAANFKFALSADMSKNFSATEIVDIIKVYGSNPHYLKIAGRPLLSTYGGQNKGNQWWKDNVITPLMQSGHPVTFIPNFDRDDPNATAPSPYSWSQTIGEYPVADGLFSFILPGSVPFKSVDPRLGNHKWSMIEGGDNLAVTLHTNRKLYMATYMPYYWAVCHPARQYLEFRGGQGMDNIWRAIILNRQTDAVEIVTWNDFAESTFIQPTPIPSTKTPGIASMPHTGYYELLKYYIAWYRTHRTPTITKDALFYFYRTQPIRPYPATDTACPLGPVSPRQLWGDVQDVVYITTALTSPAELRITSGNQTSRIPLSAGLNSTEVPFKVGGQHFELWRNGKPLTKADGIPITASDSVQNLNVYSGYTVVNGSASTTWAPSDRWKNAPTPVSDWFSSRK